MTLIKEMLSLFHYTLGALTAGPLAIPPLVKEGWRGFRTYQACLTRKFMV